MIKLLAIAALAITSSAAVAVERRLPVSTGVVDVAVTRAPADATACPYSFDSDMPPATFCVYQGIALDDGGEVCATDVVVIWSSAAPARAASGSTPKREVYLGFIADPELVVRGVVGSRQGDRAEMVGYTLGSAEAAPLAGQLRLRAVREKGDVLSLNLSEAPNLSRGDCTLAQYSGTFVGLIQPPAEYHD